MSEEQNQDNVTLAAIQKEIKDMRDDAKVQHQEIKKEFEDMRDDAKAQHKDSLYFAAYVLSVGVGLVGISFLVSLMSPPCRQMFNAVGFVLLGGGGAVYFYWKGKKLREEQKQKKALKGR